MSIDISSEKARADFLKDITTSEDNISRKREMKRRFDVYYDRQAPYIEEQMRDEFSEDTIKSMRKILSLNVSKKIIDSQASIYTNEPEREFSNASEPEVEQLKNMYELNKINAQLRIANRFYKLFKQAFLLVVPQSGKLMVKALGPHQLDVIPKDENPEEAQAYVLNVFDDQLHETTRQLSENNDRRYFEKDEIDNTFADGDDNLGAARNKARYIWWTEDAHFVTNGRGEIVEGMNSEGVIQANPIGRIPIIDIAAEKDFRFFVERGQNITQFALDFGVQVSDLSNIIRLQGHAQAIMVADQKPTSLSVGPDHVIFLQKNPQSDFTPSFAFASPNPDLSGSLSFLEAQLKMFLSAEGLDSSIISGSSDTRTFSSGMDRLLHLLDRFEASKTDIDIFRCVEMELFDLIVNWTNVMRDADSGKTFKDDLRISKISEKVNLSINFAPPQALKTEKDIEESVKSQIREGLMTRAEGIAKIRGISVEDAKEVVKLIDQDGAIDGGGEETVDSE